MKEILVCGNPIKEFRRIMIEPKLTWNGYGWNKGEELRVYEINEKEFKLIFGDGSLIKTWSDSKCIYSEGCNLSLPTIHAKINNKKIICWNDLFFGEESFRTTYIHLLQYVCDNFKVVKIDDTCSILVELSKYNNVTLAELLRRYQEFEIRVDDINIKDELGVHELEKDSFTIKCEICGKERPLYESDMKDGNIVPTKCMCGGTNKFRYWLDKIYSETEYKNLENKAKLIHLENEFLNFGYAREKIEKIKKNDGGLTVEDYIKRLENEKSYWKK